MLAVVNKTPLFRIRTFPLTMSRRPLLRSICLLLVLRPLAAYAAETPEAILEHTRSVYAALSSYSDKGTVTKEYTATSRDTYSFTTRFNRSPRHFLFDFNTPSGGRLVIWGDPDAFHSWWKATGQANDYPNPSNTNALTLNDYPTNGAISKIVPLLYAKAALPGTIAQFVPSRLAGMEQVGDTKCFKLEGIASDSYGATGRKVNTRVVTLWIDSASYLVRKISEESPASPGMLNRITTTFDPQANPKLEDGVFRFSPPRP
jgi:outer membrane lipoprotein-sorting protein